MLDPKEILTEEGYKKLFIHVGNIENALAYIINHADDLHIGATDSSQEQTIYNMMAMVDGANPLLLIGDGETNETG